MKSYKSILAYLLMALISVGFPACSGDMEYPPAVFPDCEGTGTGASPYNVSAALVAIYSGNYTTKKVYVKGIVSKIEEFNPSYGNITYYISNDGKNENELEVYRGLGLGGDRFQSIDDLQVGDEVIVYCQLTYYNNSVAETNQGAILVSLNGSPYEYEDDVEPAGEGTSAAPYNVTAALDLIYAGAPETEIYVEGIVSKIDGIDTSYGNATYYISDSGSTLNHLEIYRGYSLGGEKFKATDELKVGDKVIVYGKVVLFNSTPEFTQGSKIASLNGSPVIEFTPSGPTAEPAGDGTVESPYNVARALEIINSGAMTDKEVYVAGIISNIKEIDTGQYGNASYYISDDGTSAGEFYIYRGLGLGGKKFTSADEIKKGDKVVLYGKLILFNSTPEMAQGGYIYSIDGNSAPNPDPNPGAGDAIYTGLVSNSDGWTIDDGTLPEGLSYVWSWKEYQGNGYLNASAYLSGTAYPTEAYAYTTIDLSAYKSASVTFDHAAKFQTTLQQLCAVVVRDQSTREWTKLAIPTWPAAGSWTFVSAGTIDLSAYAGKKIEIGFLYGSSAAGADTWEIKNFVVSAAK